MIQSQQAVAMDTIVECIMNVSEGRDKECLAVLAGTIAGVPDCYLLSVSSDYDHNRSVFSFIGTSDSISESAYRIIERAADSIDLRVHEGVHPRIGAVDVVPFVPVHNVDMNTCVGIAHQLGRRVAENLSIPVYFYERAALLPERRNLAELRKGGLPKLTQEIVRNPDRKPDLGPSALHPTAGAIVIGARPALIAYNIYLKTPDITVARLIAGRIRERDGGLPCVKALGFFIATRKQAQVSMNLTDFRRTSLLQVFEKVRAEAVALQVEVDSSEIIGLVPAEALPAGQETTLLLADFQPDQILENRIRKVLADQALGPRQQE